MWIWMKSLLAAAGALFCLACSTAPARVVNSGSVIALERPGDGDRDDRHWLIGTWEGALQQFPYKSERTMIVTWTSNDIARGGWFVPGGKIDPAFLRVDGERISVITAFEDVQLTRVGNDALEGHVTLKDGEAFPVGMTR